MGQKEKMIYLLELEKYRINLMEFSIESARDTRAVECQSSDDVVVIEALTSVV